MRFMIDASVFDLYPSLKIGILVVLNADNAGAHLEIADLLRSAEEQVRARMTEETFKADPYIAVWQDAHRKFGSNPNKDPPSIQALVKRVVKGGQLPSINPLVDLYNVISLRYILPAGGEDLDHCVGDIRLTVADGTEEFVELGATENAPPEKGEVIYRDDQGVICRKFNWREADRTKLTKNTRNAVLVIEDLSGVALENALQDLQSCIEKFCGASTQVFTLYTSQMECVLLS